MGAFSFAAEFEKLINAHVAAAAHRGDADNLKFMAKLLREASEQLDAMAERWGRGDAGDAA
jgi:hypothetical protein